MSLLLTVGEGAAVAVAEMDGVHAAATTATGPSSPLTCQAPPSTRLLPAPPLSEADGKRLSITQSGVAQGGQRQWDRCLAQRVGLDICPRAAMSAMPLLNPGCVLLAEAANELPTMEEYAKQEASECPSQWLISLPSVTPASSQLTH